ncbi:MAG: hypothetical protein IAE93_16235, partial [Ignavibacteria bacterium]|nr:hypothetical protein [Ignavibacteria bacterium]
MPIIKLPRKRLLAMDRESITVDMPDKRISEKGQLNSKILKSLEGIWKSKKSD